VRPLYEGITTLRGSDFLSALTVKAAPATAADRILATLPITPSGYVGTRVTQLSQVWERYRLKRFSLRYVPAVPNTLAAQLVGYIDTDPNDDPTIITDTDALVRQATAQAGSQQWNFIHSKVIPLARRADDQWYYTGLDKSNERFNRQGTGYIVQVTEPIGFDGVPLVTDLVAGSLYIDWEVEFQIAQIEPAAVVEADLVLPVDVTDTNAVTVSDTITATLTLDRECSVGLGDAAIDASYSIRIDGNTLALITTGVTIGITSMILPAGSYTVNTEDVNPHLISFTLSSIGPVIYSLILD
jgi:hypothetical protein